MTNYWQSEQRINPLSTAYQTISKETSQQNERGKQEIALAPIGVFDSGVGGLTILSALQQALPQEDFIYFGDTAHNPYGARSEEEITSLTLQACRFLIEQG